MKVKFILISMCFAVVACNHDSGGSATPTPTLHDRTTENHSSECPATAEGRYSNVSDFTQGTAMQIIREGGIYYITDDTGSRSVIDGSITSSSDGSKASIICRDGGFDMQAQTSDGFIAATVTFNSSGFTVNSKNLKSGRTDTETFTKKI